MKNVYFNSNDSLVTLASPNQTGETLPRDYRTGTISSLCRNLTLLFAILTMSLANIGMAWGADYTFALTDFTESPSGTYTKTLSEFKCKNYTNIFVEVPSASASGTVSWLGHGAGADRFLYIYKTNGTVKDETRKIVYAKSYGSVDFTSSDIKTSGGKYYLVFGTTDDWKADGVKYILAASSCDWNINYITNGLKDGNGSAVWSENNCFEQVGSTHEWILEDFEMPDVAGQFWVGPGEFKAPAAWGHSVIADLSTIKWVYRSDKTRTDKSAVTNMTGTLNVWDDGGDDNYHIGIYPDYQITYGVDGSGGWTKVDFNHVSGTEYRTEIVTAPSGYKSNDNFKYYVGLRVKDNGNTYWGDKSSTVKMNGMSGMSSTDQAGKKGQWKIYEDSGSDNYSCSWIPVYTLTYNANGGEGAPEEASVASDQVPCQVTISTTIPTRAGYTFLGWSTNSAADTPDTGLAASDVGTPRGMTGDVTLYAVWEIKTTTITLDKNNSDPGSTSGSATVTYGSGTLTSYTAATRTGYTLASYKNETSGGSIIIKADGSLNSGDKGDILDDGLWAYDGATITLYAQWTANKFDVTHTLSHVTRLSGGEAGSNKATYGSAYSVVFAASSGYTLPATVTVTIGGTPQTAGTGYTWNKGTGTLTIPAAYVTGAIVITVTGEVAVVAYATSIDFEAIIDESGTGAAWKTTMEGRNYTLTQADGSKWSLDGGNSGAKPADKGLKIKETGDAAGKITFTVRANQTVELKVGTLAGTGSGNAKFSTDGGSSYSNITGAATASTGASVITTYTGATDRTYVFKTNSASYNILQHIIIGYKITYDKGANGTGTINPMYKTYGTNITLSSSTFTYAGHIQDGWSTSDGGSKVYELGASYTTDAPITLYPHWVAAAVTYSITYNCDGADSGCPSNVAAATNLPNPLPAAPVKTGYIFEGWYTNAGKTDAAVAGAALSANTTLYAKWIEVEEKCVTPNSSWLATYESAKGAGSYALLDGVKYDLEYISDDASGMTMGWIDDHDTYVHVSVGNLGVIREVQITIANVNSTPGDPSQKYGFIGEFFNENEFAAHEIDWDGSNFVQTTSVSNGETVSFRPTSGSNNSFIFQNFWSELKISHICIYYESICSAPTSAIISGGGAKLQHEAVELTASATGTDASTTYTWYRSNSGEAAAIAAGAIQATKTAAAGGNSYSIADCAPEDAFVYYCVISNGAGCNVTASTSISVTAAYILTYDANAGGDAVSNLPEPEVHTPGTYTLSSSVPTRAGYTFDCWNRNAAGTGDCFAAGASFTTGALNETLYAKWTEDVVGFTVTYNYNGATSGASPANETAASVTLPTPTRTGYELQGWYTTDGIKAGDGGDTYNPTANITLYAKWYATCSAGSGIEWDFTSMSERSFTTSNTGTGGNVNEISSTTGTGTLYYYAGSSCAITEKSSTMCLALGGGSSSGTVNGNATYQNRCFYIDITSNGTLLIRHNSSANNAPSYQITGATRPGTSGYTSQSAMGTGDNAYKYQITVSSYNASTACRIWVIYPNKSYIEDITWTPASGGTCYHVTYDGNGATSGFVNDTTAYKSGDEVTVLDNDGRYPYVLGTGIVKGWADSDAKADEGTVDYAPGATFTITADKTLYAVWSDEYPITYHLNGASWAEGYSATESYSYGMAVVTLPEAEDMSNPGYTFNGWYANSDLSTGGVVTTIGTSEYGAKEFWAKWTENTYTVTYNANGGTGSMETTVGRYVYLRENTFTYDGHIFMGWNTAANGSGISYNDEDEVELTADMTLYAQWGSSLDATWSVTKIDGKLYRGGGGYSVTVYLNQADWDASGDVTALELTATEGVVLSNITKTVNGEGKAQVTANFGITTGVAADATAITFTLSVPAAGTYASVDLPHNETLDDCSGSGGTVSIFDGTIDNTNTKDAIKYKQDKKWTDPTTSFASTAVGVKDPLYVFADNSWSTSNVTVSGKKYLRGIQQGGSNAAENHFKLEIPTGTTATIYFVGGNTGGAPLFGLNKSAIAPQSGTHADKVWYGEHGSSKVLRGWTIENIPSGTYYLVGNNGNCIFAEVTVTLTPLGGGGSGPVTPTLNWETDLSGGVSKKTSDDDFVHTASQDMNSLGAITYSSNNTAVATVNATTGEVHLEGDGTATITATIAASGCYNTASVSYVVTVEDDCDDVAGTITTEDLGCAAGIKMTVTGHTAAAGVSYQWYKVGTPDVTVGSNQDNYTTTTAGSYYVIVTNTGDRHCAKRSRNTVEVAASASASATKIVDSWYVKNGRRTPDVELVQTTNANGFIVKIGDTKIWDSDGSEKTGFGGCGFHMGENGIIYLNGTTAEDGSGDAPSGLTEDVILKITAEGCGGNASELSITIHCQAATTRKSIAFVVDGTEKGTFDQASADHSTNSALFKFLDYGDDSKGAFDLTAQNIYSSVDETAIREHFSQFDAILITDDPNTGTKKDGKSYVNAFGTMIDVRPILSMEAYVSKLSNWKDKGVSGTPSSPNPRQYEMRLQCKDHEIYAGLPAPAPGTHVWAEFIDGDEYRHVIMVDSTKSPYAGVAYNEQTAGDKKPALQGFESEDMGNLLGLGLILNGTLHAGVERQEEPAARMMLLGIQNKALPNALTEEGKKVIENALTYLLKTNMEEVDDCSNFFKGGDSSKPKDWNTLANWSKATFPNYETKVRILAPCEVSGIQVRVAQVDIATSGTSSKIPSGTCSGSLTIKEDGALIVGGKVRTAEAPRFGVNELKPTTASDLKVCSSSSGTGALIFDNSDGKAQATVEMWNPSHWETVAGKKKKYWSYVGVPITNVEIPDYFYLGFTYLYDETSGWIKKWDGDVLQPFEGIGLSMQSGNKETFYGTLASTATKEITLTKTAEGGNGENLIGNSWTAPIQIANFKTADFGEATATVYVYNTGRDEQASGETGEASYGDNNSATAGQWVSVPVSAAKLDGYTGLKVIPAMNAFQVNTSSETTLTLDYDTLVRKNAASNEGINSPMRAPRRAAAKAIDALMRVRVSGEKTHTDVWLLQDEQFSDDFDNGWEAIYAVCDNRSAQLYAVSELGQMAFIAKPDLDGTLLGFAPSRDGNEYTFSFQYTGDEVLYLNDMQEETSTLINEENTYMFTYSENDMTGRFIISAQPFGIPAVITGNESINTDAKPIKFIRENKMYILVNGILYDATGKIVVR